MLGFYNYTVILTYMSLISAVVGTTLAFEGNTFGAVFCLMFSGFCDMFDGKVAKTMDRTEDEKKFGIQIAVENMWQYSDRPAPARLH